MSDITLLHGDCLDLMRDIPDGSVDAIIADLPYGTTACKWDTVIPFEPLWAHYKRIIKRNGAIVLFGSQPFTSALVMSNPQMFRYEWVWDKVNRITGALNANRLPMKQHENILIFYKYLPTYNKQIRYKPRITGGQTSGHGRHTQYGRVIGPRPTPTANGDEHNPTSLLSISAMTAADMGLHPTQKPVALLEYLIRTYTNEGEMVLDNTMGSGTTGVACVNTGRRFIGIEKDAGYFQIAEKRIQDAQNKARQMTMLEEVA